MTRTSNTIEFKIYSELELFYRNYNLNEVTFLQILLKVMEHVEKSGQFTGLQKKRLVKTIMKRFLKTLKVNGTFKMLKDYYLDNDHALDNHIDVIISVSKGSYNLNKNNIFKRLKSTSCCSKGFE